MEPPIPMFSMTAEGFPLFIFSSRQVEACREQALAGGGFAVSATEEGNALLVFDDGGKLLEYYEGVHGASVECPPSRFAIFLAGGFLCGLSTGYDLLMPEHARALTLGGIDLLCIFCAPEICHDYPVEAIAIARAVENQIFTALITSSTKSSRVFGPFGKEIFLSENIVGENVYVLHKKMILENKKILPLGQMRRKELYHSLIAL